MTYKNGEREISNSLIQQKSTRSGFKIQLNKFLRSTPTHHFKMICHKVNCAVFLLFLIQVGWAAVVGEKREMGYGTGGYSGYDAAPAYAAPQAAPSQGYTAPQPVYGPSPYTNPGFSVQTGFEGFLVPNSWYGLLPWGVEGVIVVIVGVIVFIVISVVILGLIAWLTGFGDYAIVKESRNLLPSLPTFDAITDVTNTVLDALDKYDELQVKKIK